MGSSVSVPLMSTRRFQKPSKEINMMSMEEEEGNYCNRNRFVVTLSIIRLLSSNQQVSEFTDTPQTNLSSVSDKATTKTDTKD